MQALDSDPEVLLAAIGANLREKREARKFTRDQLAEKTGVSRNTIVRYEKGEIGKVQELSQLASALGTSLLELLGPHYQAKMASEKRLVALDEPGARVLNEQEVAGALDVAQAEIKADRSQQHRQAQSGISPRLPDAMEKIASLPAGTQLALLEMILESLPPETLDRVFDLIQAYCRGHAAARSRKR